MQTLTAGCPQKASEARLQETIVQQQSALDKEVGASARGLRGHWDRHWERHVKLGRTQGEAREVTEHRALGGTVEGAGRGKGGY